MRKLFALILAVMLVICMAVSVSAVTPTIKVSITKPEIKVSDSFWDKWFAEHPIVIPAQAEPALGTPEITTAHYNHSRSAAHSNLKIEWTAVDGAERYEVLITLANGETIAYTETDTYVNDYDAVCPQLAKGENGHIAYVKVRAIAVDTYGAWSAEDTVSCNALHFG